MPAGISARLKSGQAGLQHYRVYFLLEMLRKDAMV
jgi:hypothetical protein